jgi:hypothetical protein
MIYILVVCRRILWKEFADKISIAITSHFGNILRKYGIVKGNSEANQMVIRALAKALLPPERKEQRTFEEQVQVTKGGLESEFLKHDAEEETFSQRIHNNSTSRQFHSWPLSLSQRSVELASKLSAQLQQSQDEVVAKALDMYWQSVNNKQKSSNNKVAKEESEMETED